MKCPFWRKGFTAYLLTATRCGAPFILHRFIPHYTCHQLPCPWWAVTYNDEVRTVCIYRVANSNVTLKFHCAICCYKYCVLQSRQWGEYLRYSTKLTPAQRITQWLQLKGLTCNFHVSKRVNNQTIRKLALSEFPRGPSMQRIKFMITLL
jgi:hypothetical protein